MADGLLAYSGLATKVKAMRARLLPRTRLMQLTECGSVEEMISFLREYEGYAEVFASRDDVADRAQVEAVIGNSLYQDYGRIYRFADRGQRAALAHLFWRYEIDELKYCFGQALRREDGAKQRIPEPFFAGHASFDLAAAADAGSVEELLQILRGTRYEKVSEAAWRDAAGDYARCAVQLDIQYYRMAWKYVGGLADRRTREICTRLLGTEIDWQNVMWLYRARRFYGGDALGQIPVSYRLRKAEWKRLSEAEQEEDFLRTVRRTAYFTGQSPEVMLEDEISYRAVMEAAYRKICGRYPVSIAPVLKYFYDKEREIDALTTILEGVRYRIPAREIQGLVEVLP